MEKIPTPFFKNSKKTFENRSTVEDKYKVLNQMAIMKIWTEICLEPRGPTIDDKHTIVLYLSEKKIKLKAKTRAGVSKALLRLGAQVFGACAPVNKQVIQIIKELNGKKLTQNTLDKINYTPTKVGGIL